jgi:DNA-directed RNA polymerase specialized sigma24 family protein
LYDSATLSFDTTRWSVIAAARGADPEAARAALSTLCEAYWYPLYAFIRRWGADPDAARDLTQGFFASLLERRDIEQVRPERGRFRTFLLASAKHFLLNEAARSRATKRGGGVPPIPLAFDDAEGRYQFEPADETTPETLYERRWALTVLERVIAMVQAKWRHAGRGAEFDVLKASLLGEGPPGGYAAAANTLGTTEGAVKVAVHRLRKTFRTELRAAIAETVSNPADVDEELNYLERALRS